MNQPPAPMVPMAPQAAAAPGATGREASAERILQIADSIDLVFWVHEFDPHEHVSYCSPAFERVWGRPLRSLYDDPGVWMAAIHPEDRMDVAAAFELWRADPSNYAYRVQYRILRPDGGERWIADRGCGWFDADGRAYRLTGVAEDITDVRLAEQRARDSQRHVEALTEALPQWVWTCDAAGRCDFLSPRCVAYAGAQALAPGGDAPLPWMALLHPADAEPARRDWLRSLHREAEFESQVRLRGQDGGHRWFAARAIPLRGEDGRLQRWFGTCTDIDDLKRAEAALREERERLDAITRSSPSVLHTYRRGLDGRGSYPHGIERIAALFEMPVDALRADADAVRTRIDRSQLDELEASVEASARTLQPWLMQFRIRTPSRGEVWVEGHSRPVREPDGSLSWHGSLTDVTARHAVEQALRDSQAQLRSVFDHLQDGLIAFSPQGEALQWNAVALRMHGLSDADAPSTLAEADMAVFELHDLDGTFVPISRWPVSRILAGETLRELEQRVHHRRQGWHRVFSYSGALLLGDDGRPILSLMQMRDVTERRREQDELQQLTQRLEDRVRERTVELEAANSELEAFSFSVSHDLRAPLRAMDGFAQLLLRDHAPQLAADGQRYLGIVRDSARSMTQLIDDLLGFARLSRQPLDRRPVRMAALVREVIGGLAPQQQGRDVRWQIGELPDAEGDLAMLRQVWVNLLSNALKYSRQRQPAVIEVGSLRGEHGCEYAVRDNGSGFDMAYAGRLFGVFQRLHRDEEFEGTGVGLALVKRIVQRHGGRVRAEGRPGEGASFFFTLGD